MQGLTVWVFRHRGFPGRGQGSPETGVAMVKPTQVGLLTKLIGFRFDRVSGRKCAVIIRQGPRSPRGSIGRRART